jgi:hypothetical protein
MIEIEFAPQLSLLLVGAVAAFACWAVSGQSRFLLKQPTFTL